MLLLVLMRKCGYFFDKNRHFFIIFFITFENKFFSEE